MRCRIMQQSDETSCGTCGLRWDTNDPAPPPCPNPTPKPVFPDVKAIVFGTGIIPVENDPTTSRYVVLGPFENVMDAVDAAAMAGSLVKKLNRKRKK